jgi:hypothetical protein
MTKWDSSDCGFLLIGPYDLLSVTGTVEDGATLQTKETTPLGVEAERYDSSGVRAVTFTQKGWFDDGANSMHEALKELPTTYQTLMFAFKGNVKARAFKGCGAQLRVGYQVGVNVGDVHSAIAAYAVSGGIEEGFIVQELAALAGDGNSDAQYVDLGAAGANGGAVYAACSALTLSGRPDVTLKLRHSTDHITFADLVSMTAMSTIASERKTFAGAINRYVSASRAFGGAGGTPSLTFALGVVVNP